MLNTTNTWGNVLLLKICMHKTCIMLDKTKKIFYIIFIFFILHIQIIKILVLANVNKLKKTYIFNVEKERTNEENDKCYKRCLAEHASFDNEDKHLVNQLKIPILELEKSFQSSSANVLLNNASFMYLRNAPKVLSVLIERVLINNIKYILPLLVRYKNVIDANLHSSHKKIEKKMKHTNDKIEKDLKKKLFSLEPNVLREIMILYNNLEMEKVHDESYLKMVLCQLQYLKHIHPVNKSIQESFGKHCKYIEKKKKKLENVIDDANKVAHNLHVGGIENRNRFPFFLKDVIFFDTDVTPLYLHKLVTDRIKKDLKYGKSKGCRMTLYINPYKNEMNLYVVENAISLMSMWIKYIMGTLLKSLSMATGGPLRGIVALFLYIFKIAKTKNIYDNNSQWYRDKCIFNRVMIKYYLSLLYKKEKKIMQKSYLDFKKYMNILFKIDVTDKKIKDLCKRLSYSENLDDILELFYVTITSVFIRKQMTQYFKMLNVLQKRVNNITEKKRNELKIDNYVPVRVKYSFFSFSTINYSFKKEVKLLNDVLKVMTDKMDVENNIMDTKENIKLLEIILDWMSLFLNMQDQSNNQLTKKKKKKDKDTFSESSTGVIENKKEQKQKELQNNIAESSQAKLMRDEDAIKLNMCENVNTIEPRALYVLFCIIYHFCCNNSFFRDAL